MKIIIALLIPILLGIVVGSNLLPTMTVVIFNQPTIALPIGVWLIIAIGLGLLSRIGIQLLIAIERRLLKQQIRQLQSRSQQQDDDIFTHTPTTESGTSSPCKTAGVRGGNEPPAPAKPSRFKSYRSNLAEQFASKPSPQPIVNDDSDDWDAQPVRNRQLDWEDSPPLRQQNLQSPANRSPIETDAPQERQSQQIYADRSSQTIDDRLTQTSRQVYDADFRLIQPPYKQPLETELDDELDSADLEYDAPNQADDKSTSSVKPTSPNRSTPSSNLDDEDWGFDFDDRDPPARAN
jgi:hypothetical protein